MPFLIILFIGWNIRFRKSFIGIIWNEISMKISKKFNIFTNYSVYSIKAHKHIFISLHKHTHAHNIFHIFQSILTWKWKKWHHKYSRHHKICYTCQCLLRFFPLTLFSCGCVHIYFNKYTYYMFQFTNPPVCLKYSVSQLMIIYYISFTSTISHLQGALLLPYWWL